MPMTSGPLSVSSSIGEPDEAPPVSQVCRMSTSGSEKSCAMVLHSECSKLLPTPQGCP